VDQVLLLLVLPDNFVDTQEEPFFDQNVSCERRVVLEKVANNLNQAFFHANLDIAGKSEVFLAHAKIGHLRHKLLLSLFLHCDIHLFGLFGLRLLFLLGMRELWLGLFGFLLFVKDVADIVLLFEYAQIGLDAVASTAAVLLCQKGSVFCA